MTSMTGAGGKETEVQPRIPGWLFVLAVMLFWGLLDGALPDLLGISPPRMWPPFIQIAVGSAIILLYAALDEWAGGRENSEDAVDASYFLGFIMTLLFLIYGLLESRGGIDAEWVGRFIRDLGVGLAFSVVGLSVRQWRALKAGRVLRAGDDGARGGVSAPVVAEMERLAGLAAQLESSSRQAGPGERERIAEVTRDFETRVSQSTKRLGTAIEALIGATSRAAAEIGRASSGLRTDLKNDLEALSQGVGDVVSEVGKARTSLKLATEEAQKTQELVGTTARDQAKEWEAQLRQTHGHLAQLRAVANKETSEALDALKASSGSLKALAEQVLEKIKQMPDPAERLQRLWGTLEKKEADIAAAAGASVGKLEHLGERAGGAADQLDTLNRSALDGAKALSEGAGSIRSALLREADEMDRLVTELSRIMETRIDKLGRR